MHFSCQDMLYGLSKNCTRRRDVHLSNVRTDLQMSPGQLSIVSNPILAVALLVPGFFGMLFEFHSPVGAWRVSPA